MPFVDQEHRDKPDLSIPGDRCYLKAVPIWDEWRKSERWTTIDNLWKPFFPDDEKRAHFLALMVHFIFEAVPYEEKKKEENGEI